MATTRTAGCWQRNLSCSQGTGLGRLTPQAGRKDRPWTCWWSPRMNWTNFCRSSLTIGQLFSPTSFLGRKPIFRCDFLASFASWRRIILKSQGIARDRSRSRTSNTKPASGFVQVINFKQEKWMADMKNTSQAVNKSRGTLQNWETSKLGWWVINNQHVLETFALAEN